MIRSLILHDVDFTWSGLRMTADRKAAVDYLLPYYKQHYTLVIISTTFTYIINCIIIECQQVIKRHEEENNAWYLFLRPLNMELWMALTLHSLILIMTLRLFWCYYNRKMNGGQDVSIRKIVFGTFKYYLILSSSYLGKGYANMPHTKESTVKVGR